MNKREIIALLEKPAELAENTYVEFKEASGGLPMELWETYSSFANTEGGLIILGVAEDRLTHDFSLKGLADPHALEHDFWDAVRNPERVSADIMLPDGVSAIEVSGKTLLLISVPRAERYKLPVRIYDRRRKAFVAYVRRGEADHVANEDELRQFAYDSSRDADKEVLSEFGLDALCMATVARYRSIFGIRKPGHPWRDDSDLDFLYHIGAIARDRAGELRPTRAGLLAFGWEYEITNLFPHYLLDYREERNDVLRWTDRVVSTTGDWSGNLVDFYLDAMNRLDRALPSPFALDSEGIGHTTNTPLKDAANEALANALVHAYYGGASTVRVILGAGALEVVNSGTLVIDREVALAGGTSEARNPTLMKIFGNIGRIDRAGSGLNAIWATCQAEFGVEPELEVRYTPQEVRLRMPIGPMVADGATDSGELATDRAEQKTDRTDRKTDRTDRKTDRTEMPTDVTDRETQIITFIGANGEASSSQVADHIGFGPDYTKAILRGMVERGLIEKHGDRRYTRYTLPEQDEDSAG